jgi:hypothetical protein
MLSFRWGLTNSIVVVDLVVGVMVQQDVEIEAKEVWICGELAEQWISRLMTRAATNDQRLLL